MASCADLAGLILFCSHEAKYFDWVRPLVSMSQYCQTLTVSRSQTNISKPYNAEARDRICACLYVAYHCYTSPQSCWIVAQSFASKYPLEQWNQMDTTIYSGCWKAARYLLLKAGGRAHHQHCKTIRLGPQIGDIFGLIGIVWCTSCP